MSSVAGISWSIAWMLTKAAIPASTGLMLGLRLFLKPSFIAATSLLVSIATSARMAVQLLLTIRSRSLRMEVECLTTSSSGGGRIIKRVTRIALAWPGLE